MPKPEDFAARELVVRSLLKTREGLGCIPTAEVEYWAEELGVDKRTVWRWVENGSPPSHERSSYQLTERDRELYYDWRGNVSAIHRVLVAELGAAAPSIRTLGRAYDRELSSADRAFATRGEKGRREQTVYLRWEAPYRNHTCQADHKELPILVVPPRGKKPRRPWATIFQDDATRAIKGISLAMVPDQATVLAAMKQSILGDPESGLFGGVAERMVWDNGREFLAKSVNQVALSLGCYPCPTPAYMPHQKGKIERLNRTIVDELLRGLPFFAHGPRGANDRLFAPGGDPMAFEAFVELVFAWVKDYNHERAHSALGGRTPAEAWQDDPTPLNEVPEDELRWLAIPSVNRKVLHDGIHHERLIYIAAELDGLGGETVEVRFMPHDRRKIDVFHQGKWLCEAFPQETLTAEERERVLIQRQETYRRQSAEMRRASQRARRRITPATASGGGEDATVIVRSPDERPTHDLADYLRRSGTFDDEDLGEGLDEPLEGGR